MSARIDMYVAKHETKNKNEREDQKDQNAADETDSLEGQEPPQSAAILEQRLKMLEQTNTALRLDSSRNDPASERLQQQQEDVETASRLRLIQDRLVQVKLTLTSPVPLAAEDLPVDVLALAYRAVDDVDYRARLGALIEQLREDEREEWRHLRRLEEINCLTRSKNQQQLPQHQDLSQEQERDQMAPILGEITDSVTKVVSHLETIASTKALEETPSSLRSRPDLDQQDQPFQENSANLQRILARIKTIQEAYSVYERFGSRMTVVHLTATVDVDVLLAWTSDRSKYGAKLLKLIGNLRKAEEDERNHLRKLRQLKQSWKQANRQGRASPPENIHARPHHMDKATWELYNAVAALNNAFERVHNGLTLCSNKPELDPACYEDSAELKHTLATLDCIRDEIHDVCRNGYRATMFFGKNVAKVTEIMEARHSSFGEVDYLENLGDYACSLQAEAALEIDLLRNKQIQLYEHC
ncbi:hypothetical protein BGZ51_009864 [Haplosporangium sp. Z 767]|nr:hypothetical protein BGZ50_002198 [Haplosporangium sp. Z 11]KAF9189098.1 hypothetical protein BGZ51_009864 [Haplosporangium sp. Z 767]